MTTLSLEALAVLDRRAGTNGADIEQGDDVRRSDERNVILEALSDNKEPLSAGEVLGRLPRLFPNSLEVQK